MWHGDTDADADRNADTDAGSKSDADAGVVPTLHEPNTHPYPGWRAWYD